MITNKELMEFMLKCFTRVDEDTYRLDEAGRVRLTEYLHEHGINCHIEVGDFKEARVSWQPLTQEVKHE